MRNITILIASLTLVLACAGSEDGASPTASTASSAAKLYDQELSKQPCALLTPAMVASVAGVAVDAVEQRALSVMCLYEWEGGNANIAFVRIYDDSERAATRFENAHQSMTGAEVKEAMASIGQGAKERLEEEAKTGKDVPDAQDVDVVTGAMSGSMGGGITFEAVQGLGDNAAYETTRHAVNIGDRVLVSYANKLDVLIGNLTFGVSFSLDGQSPNAKAYEDQTVALAQAVLEGLPK